MIARSSLCLLVILGLPAAAAPTATPAPAPAGESYFGFDLDLLAKSFACLTTYRTKYGEAEGKTRFEQWLASVGKDRPGFDGAYDAWWKRWKADPTGRQEARFHTLNQKYTQEMNFADVPSRAQEKRAGVTLDQYARISVAMTRPPAADAAQIDRVLRRNGLTGGAARWKKVGEAWGQAMREDTSFALTQQYAALYQKYAGPELEKQHEDTMAKSFAEHNRMPPPPRSDTAAPPGVDAALGRLAAAAPERWSAAREVLRQCALWAGPGRKNAADPRAAPCAPAALRAKVLPVVLDAVDHHGDDTLNAATNSLGFLADLGLKDAAVRAALERALLRDRDRLAKLRADFAPIQDKAVPERVFLRSKLDGYEAVVREIEQSLANW